MSELANDGNLASVNVSDSSCQCSDIDWSDGLQGGDEQFPAFRRDDRHYACPHRWPDVAVNREDGCRIVRVVQRRRSELVLMQVYGEPGGVAPW